MPLVLAQTGSSLPKGGVEAVVWLLVASVIVGLYLIIRRTRIKTRRHYLDQQKHQEENRRNDPDMRND